MNYGIFDSFDANRMVFTFEDAEKMCLECSAYELTCDGDSDCYSSISVPAKYEVCPSCEGHGKSSAYLGAITQDEWESDWDYEERERYVRGDYDQTCPKCNGLRIIPVVDRDRVEPELLKRIDAAKRDLDDFRAEQESERRYGA